MASTYWPGNLYTASEIGARHKSLYMVLLFSLGIQVQPQISQLTSDKRKGRPCSSAAMTGVPEVVVNALSFFMHTASSFQVSGLMKTRCDDSSTLTEGCTLLPMQDGDNKNSPPLAGSGR
mmetsp:Transcript_51547/g.122623  ORF Transcript_51547/g.122623 Transcript_51547/m.122623 type:complete len:120 (-) Transcript_51547:1463-1822(-)